MKKASIKLKEPIDTIPVLLIAISVVFVVVLFFSKKILLAILFAVIPVFIRLVMGKLYIHEGDQIFVCGLPGSGKSMFLAKIAKDNHKSKYIWVNKEFEHLKIKDGVIDRDDLGVFRFGSGSRTGVVLYDESSFDGFDNRDYKINFKNESGKNVLKGLKKARHRHYGIVYANQGFEELDKKIRSGLVKSVYWVRNKGFYSVAIRLDKDFKIDEITGEPQECYLKPSIFTRLIDPSSYIYIIHRYYGRFYDTINDDSPFFGDSLTMGDSTLESNEFDEIMDDDSNFDQIQL